MGFEIRPVLDERERSARGGARTALVPRPTPADVGFLFGVMRLLKRQAAADRAGHPGAAELQAAAQGAEEALLWVIGATDVAASQNRWPGDLVGGLRPDHALGVEVVALESMRSVGTWTPAEVQYLRGAGDAVSFARGWHTSFWWAPLPGPLRPGRDDVGRLLV